MNQHPASSIPIPIPILAAALSFVIAAAPLSARQSGGGEVARLRLGHFASATAAVDVYADGELLSEALPYGAMRGDYVFTPGLDIAFEVVPTGETPGGALSLVVGALDAQAFGTLLLIDTDATGATPLAARLLWIDETQAVEVARDNLSVAPNTFVHQMPGSLPITARANGEPVVEFLGYGQYAISDVPGGSVQWEAYAGETRIENFSYTQRTGGVFFNVYAGTPDAFETFFYARSVLGFVDTLRYDNSVLYSTVDARFETLIGALEQTGLGAYLDSLESATLYAPTDAAFDRSGSVLMDPSALRDVLRYHIVEAVYDERSGVARTTLHGAPLTWKTDPDQTFVNENGVRQLGRAQMLQGVIVPIDGVMLPPT